MNTIGLIPARGGSKRLPKKNIKKLNNKPLIEYTIDASLEAQEVDRVIVSTDDSKIRKMSRDAGAEAPFLRPDIVSKDETPDRPVILHLIDYLENNENLSPHIIVYLRPTTPFKTPEIIDSAVKKLKRSNLDSIRSVTKVKGKNHPYWTFKTENGLLKSFIKDIDLKKYYQSQLLPNCYHLNGVVDATRVETVKKQNNCWGKKVGFVELDELVSIDIDTQLDFQFADFIIKTKNDLS